jgi:hypothetical protein
MIASAGYGTQRSFAPMQQDAGNRGLCGWSADAMRPDGRRQGVSPLPDIAECCSPFLASSGLWEFLFFGRVVADLPQVNLIWKR